MHIPALGPNTSHSLQTTFQQIIATVIPDQLRPPHCNQPRQSSSGCTANQLGHHKTAYIPRSDHSCRLVPVKLSTFIDQLRAFSSAHSVILTNKLSPSCTSYDQADNFEQIRLYPRSFCQDRDIGQVPNLNPNYSASRPATSSGLGCSPPTASHTFGSYCSAQSTASSPLACPQADFTNQHNTAPDSLPAGTRSGAARINQSASLQVGTLMRIYQCTPSWYNSSATPNSLLFPPFVRNSQAAHTCAGLTMPPRRRGRGRGQLEESAGYNEDRRSAPSRTRSRHEEEEEVGDLPTPVERMDVVIARFQKMNPQVFNGDKSSEDTDSWLRNITGLFDRVQYDNELRLSLPAAALCGGPSPHAHIARPMGTVMRKPLRTRRAGQLLLLHVTVANFAIVAAIGGWAMRLFFVHKLCDRSRVARNVRNCCAEFPEATCAPCRASWPMVSRPWRNLLRHDRRTMAHESAALVTAARGLVPCAALCRARFVGGGRRVRPTSGYAPVMS
ncbi:hypothetical protein F511_13443 [Dorcoceras hygrometricum]|uniref:Uncharacterized protein n=1 Tax=Dorcoceras hygrometricum TaxID=472368 RepID=A0A2Z7AFC0_9LAMI|nr:hypothetical protein F511_13443 [Dorcoceras hygrometricum]